MQIKEKLKGNIILIVLSVVTCVVSLLLIRQTHNHVLLNEKYLLQKINNIAINEIEGVVMHLQFH